MNVELLSERYPQRKTLAWPGRSPAVERISIDQVVQKICHAV